jgi:hypothetical protein
MREPARDDPPILPDGTDEEESDARWNERERAETELQRLDRNFVELLQEVRVAQTGPQILFAFLLTLAFTSRFEQVSAFQRDIYVVTLGLAAASASLLIAPVSAHRLLFRRHEKARLVAVANRLTIAGLLALCLAIIGLLWFITDVLFGRVPGVVVAIVSAVWFGALWFALPAWIARHPEGKPKRNRLR